MHPDTFKDLYDRSIHTPSGIFESFERFGYSMKEVAGIMNAFAETMREAAGDRERQRVELIDDLIEIAADLA